MQKINSLKASFLLAVFSLHTVVSTACSLGIHIDASCNNHNDYKTIKTSGHINQNCKKLSFQEGETIHQHGQKTVRKIAHSHEGIKKHNHQSKRTTHNQKLVAELSNNCCNDDIMNVNQPDKAYTKFVLFNALFFTAFFSDFLSNNILAVSQATPSIKYFVRSYHPPIPDIRIVIQSFQI
jgi:hypothetical protein